MIFRDNCFFYFWNMSSASLIIIKYGVVPKDPNIPRFSFMEFCSGTIWIIIAHLNWFLEFKFFGKVFFRCCRRHQHSLGRYLALPFHNEAKLEGAPQLFDSILLFACCNLRIFLAGVCRRPIREIWMDV